MSSRPVASEVRICMPTWRAFARAPFQCYRYEAQDVLAGLDAVDMIPLQAGHAHGRREQLLRRLMWYPTGRMAALCNPGIGEVRLERDYELFVAVCESWWDLLYINAVKGWEKRCDTSVLWLDELFVGMLPRYRHWLPTLDRFDHIVLGHLRSAEELSRILGRPCHWAPPAVDVLRFFPGEVSAARPVSFLSIGRRHAGIHSALKAFSASQGLFYVYDTLQGISMVVTDPVEHREMYATKVGHSRFLLVGPGMMGEPEAADEHVVGARFFEGAAAGAVLIGERPRCREFDVLFDWRDAVVELAIDGSDTSEVLGSLLADERRIARAAAAGVRECALRHDWLYRWKQIYGLAGFVPTSLMDDRERQLTELATRFPASESSEQNGHGAGYQRRGK